MKLLWRMYKKPNALWVQLLKGKYLGGCDIFNIEEKNHANLTYEEAFLVLFWSLR